MPNNTQNSKIPHSQQNIYAQQRNQTKTGKNTRDVWQDKNAPARGRRVSTQPVMENRRARTQQPSNKPTRSQNHSVKRRTVQVAAWVDHPIREQLLAIARSEGLSLSQTIAALLQEILRQRLHVQQAATLETVIEQGIAKAHRSLATRLAWLLVRIAFDTGQTRVIATNILGMQEGMTEHTLKDILATADQRTKANLTRRTPQLTELMAAVEQWLLQGEEEAKTR